MSQPHDTGHGTENTSRAERFERTCRQFEEAWQVALNGAVPQPQIDSFLREYSEPDRSMLVAELVKLDTQYRQMRAGQFTQQPSVAPTIGYNDAAMVDTAEPSQGPTVHYSAERPDDSHATVDAAPDVMVDLELVTEGRGDVDYTRVMTEDAESAGVPQRPTVSGYEILGELGRGGMGVVYKARQIKLDRVVALKMVLAGAHAGPEQLARFYTEAQAVAHLKHPNIVQIYEVGEQAGLPYFSLEFVDGGSLAQKAAGKPQPAEDAAYMVRLLAAAMQHAHQHGVVHRDLKPANVLLTADGAPKITDFGLAKRLEGESSSQTRSGAILGTPSYMAPEQALGEVHQVGPLTDVYALGAMLYELITGRPPFLAATPMDTVMQVVRDEPVPPTQLQPKLPRDLETICLKCLQKELSKRYASAAALAEDLRRFLAGEPILARPVSAAERLWRWSKRNPRVASLIALVSALVLTVAIVSAIAAVRISREKDIALQARDAEKTARERAEGAEKLARLNAEAEKLARLRAEEAEKEAKHSAEVADKQSGLAIRTLYTAINAFQAQLRDRPGMQKLRQDLLESAMAGLDDVVKSADPSKADRITASAYQKKADILLDLGRTREAFENYERSHAIIDTLAQQAPPDDALAKRNLAATLNKLGDISQLLAGAGTARDYYEQALQIRQEWVKLEPQNGVAQQSVATSFGLLGNVTLRMGDPQTAKQYYIESLHRYEALPPALARQPEARRERAGVCDKLGEVSLKLGDAEAALQYHQSALEIRQSVASKSTGTISASRDLAISYIYLGDVHLLLLRDVVKAREYYEQALTIYTALRAENEDSAVAQRDLSVACYRLATVLLRQGDQLQSQNYFRQSLDLREPLARLSQDDQRVRIDYMLALARCGRHSDAIAEARKLVEATPTDPWICYNAACCYAVCAEAVAPGKPDDQLTDDERELRQQYADQSVAAVQQSIENGWRDAMSLTTDPDLDPVRSTGPFLELVKTVNDLPGVSQNR